MHLALQVHLFIVGVAVVEVLTLFWEAVHQELEVMAVVVLEDKILLVQQVLQILVEAVEVQEEITQLVAVRVDQEL